MPYRTFDLTIIKILMYLNGNDNNASKTVVKYAYPIVVICKSHVYYSKNSFWVKSMFTPAFVCIPSVAVIII